MPRLLLTLYGLLGFAFLYLPIVVLIIFSFNSSAVITFPLQHFTVSWYRELREDFVLLGAVRNSILVTAVTTVGATLVGTAAAFPLVRMGFRMKRTFNLFLLLPIVIPGILTGIALLILFVPVLNLTLSLNTSNRWPLASFSRSTAAFGFGNGESRPGAHVWPPSCDSDTTIRPSGRPS